MIKKHIAFIELNTTGATINYIKNAKKKGYHIILVVSQIEYYNRFKELRRAINDYVDNIIQCDTHYNLDNLIKKLKLLPRLDGIIATHDLEIYSASYIAKALNLPFNSLEAINICRNKYLLRDFLVESNLSSINFATGENLKALLKKANEIGYPLVFKPINTTDSYGVSLIKNDNELILAYDNFNSDNGEWRGTSKNRTILLEKFQEGSLISVESISDGENISILGVTGRNLGPEPYFIEKDTFFPLQVNDELIEAIELIKKVLSKLSYNLGPAHTEIILTDHGPEIIEINPRLVGGTISEMINTIVSDDIYSYILNIYTNTNSELTTKCNGFGLSRMILPDKEGILTEFSIPECIMKDSCIKFKKNFNIGDHISFPAKQNGHTLGVITITGENSYIVNKKMNDVEQNLIVTIK
ncbi:ATP-grasp domain-containing protein [Staphylococcus gallinarum]|uniref:ATP-grasp domain-containing protein n=1 Tax=Staphylococcus gallinarum TaxID=1293 RepID=UPI002DBF51C0|nr:ATP-grasp domain-containing protein [Staphylococcus gallinarum]MEB7040098.1 ATP-grasp domain-containing protein [Staphylococcus gallinarum]